RAGGGLYHQFPGIPQTAGRYAGTNLAPQRAYHADVGDEQVFSANARWQVTLYNREERDLLHLPRSELQAAGGRLAGLTPSSPWINARDGYARGVDLLVQRRTARGLTGWLSYSFGLNRYHDRTTDESFDGDYDQRHTVNAYAMYRFTDRFSLAV